MSKWYSCHLQLYHIVLVFLLRNFTMFLHSSRGANFYAKLGTSGYLYITASMVIALLSLMYKDFLFVNLNMYFYPSRCSFGFVHFHISLHNWRFDTLSIPEVCWIRQVFRSPWKIKDGEPLTIFGRTLHHWSLLIS